METEQSIVLTDLGKVAVAQKKYDHAEKYFQEALEIDEKGEDKIGCALCLGNLGVVALDSDNLVKARMLFHKALPLAHEIGIIDMIADVYWSLAWIAEKEGHFQEVLPMAEESLRIREQLQHQYTEESRELVTRLREKIASESADLE